MFCRLFYFERAVHTQSVLRELPKDVLGDILKYLGTLMGNSDLDACAH